LIFQSKQQGVRKKYPKSAFLYTFSTLFDTFFTFFNTFLSLFDRFSKKPSLLIDAFHRFHLAYLSQTLQTHLFAPPFYPSSNRIISTEIKLSKPKMIICRPF